MSSHSRSISTRTYFALATGLVLLAGVTAAVVFIHLQMRRQALDSARSKAQLILDQNLATHAYFTEQLKPSLFESAAFADCPEQFDPTWMSSTYAVRQIDGQRRAADADDYYYKEGAVNARSPVNEADDLEREFLQELNADPRLVEREKIRTLEGETYFTVMRRGEVIEDSCLRCHSTPDRAPAELVERYGAERSFGRELGDVVSAVSIRIPVSQAYAAANAASVRLSVLLLAFAAGAFLAQRWLADRLVFAPLTKLREKARRIAGDEAQLGESMAASGGKELRDLADSFNQMSANLSDGRDHLEQRVRTRTEELTRANATLRHEVTERRRADKALRESEERFRSLFENAPLGYQSLDEQGNFIELNDTWCKLLGYTKEEVLGRNFSEFIHPDFKEHFKENFPKFKSMGYILGVEFEMVKKDGTEIIVKFDGKIGRNEDGSFRQTHCVLSDVTQRKLAEEERERLIAKLEAQNAELERFTYTVSHDLKSPLISIKGYAGLLRQDLAKGDAAPVESDLQRIANAADKMDQLLEDLLELSRIGRLVNPPEEVSMAELARETLELVAGQAEKSGVQVDVSADLPVVFGDRLRLREVLQNLLENAVKYMGDQPQPRIEIGSRRDDGETVCYVRDNGVGIDSRYHEKVFGLFDQLDPNIEGSGIGLAVVRRIIEVQGGRIWAESEGPGHGTTFCFTIPTKKQRSGLACQ